MSRVAKKGVSIKKKPERKMKSVAGYNKKPVRGYNKGDDAEDDDDRTSPSRSPSPVEEEEEEDQDEDYDVEGEGEETPSDSDDQKKDEKKDDKKDEKKGEKEEVLHTMKEVLDIDVKHRYEGVKDDVFTLTRLSFAEKIPDEHPILVDSLRVARQGQEHNIDQFKMEFDNLYPMFQDYNFDWNNVLIAGGSISNLLTNLRHEEASHRTNHDIDMFIYGTDQPNIVLKRVLNDLQHMFSDHREINEKIRRVLIETYEDCYRQAGSQWATFDLRLLPKEEPTRPVQIFRYKHSDRVRSRDLNREKKKKKSISKSAKREITTYVNQLLIDEPIRWIFDKSNDEWQLNHLKIKRILTLLATLNRSERNLISYPATKISYVRNAYSVSMFVSELPVCYKHKALTFQIILRAYKSISEILHGFDLGSSAVGYDGENVWMTTLSKYSYRNMVNIVDITRRSTTYERRLIKYFNRGFHIIFPDLNIAAIPQDNLAEGLNQAIQFHSFKFVIHNVTGNIIKFLQWGRNTEEIVDKNQVYADASDYLPNLSTFLSGRSQNQSDLLKNLRRDYEKKSNYEDERKLELEIACILCNLQTVISVYDDDVQPNDKDNKENKEKDNKQEKGEMVNYIFVSHGDWKPLLDEKAKPFLQPSNLMFVYSEFLTKHLFEQQKLQCGWVERILDHEFQRMLFALITNSFKKEKEQAAAATMKTKIRALLQAQCDKLLKSCHLQLGPQTSFPLQWKTLQPGSQKPLTGSFHPLYDLTTSDWYGKFFKTKPPMVIPLPLPPPPPHSAVSSSSSSSC